MALTLYADECVDARIVAGLRRRGVDVIAAPDECLLGAEDEKHFARATKLERVIISGDRDFLVLAQDRLASASEFPGLIFITPERRVGEVVRSVMLLSSILDASDMVSRIEWVP